jgi:hybrid cluster-associated redox disulfide protein
MRVDRIDPDMPLDEIMRRWPSTIAVMIRHRMLCIGCPIGSFHTIVEACAEHGVDEALFADELLAAIGN